MITPQLIKALNVPAMQRVQQLLVNMERMKWMPDQKSGKLILVNIPEFKLYINESG